MGKNSAIEWTNHTWNPWKGCAKVSPGCKFCYAERDFNRYKIPGGFNHNVTKTQLMKKPLTWAKKIGKDPKFQDGQKIFTCSWSDFFIEDADPWRDEAWEVIRATPEFIYQILTKRPENVLDRLPKDWGAGYGNVWIGVSTENQAEFNKRVPLLGQIPAALRFISAEPLLGPIDMGWNANVPINNICGPPLQRFGIGWVIIGGESGFDTEKGKTYRPCEMEWIHAIIKECEGIQLSPPHHFKNELEIPVFVKQLGTHLAKQFGFSLHGRDPDQWPPHFQLQQMPGSEIDGKRLPMILAKQINASIKLH